MGVFKNGVGRPSNETIRKRNIFKGICLALVLIVIILVAYIVNDKLKSNKDDNNTDKKKLILIKLTMAGMNQLVRLKS